MNSGTKCMQDRYCKENDTKREEERKEGKEGWKEEVRKERRDGRRK